MLILWRLQLEVGLLLNLCKKALVMLGLPRIAAVILILLLALGSASIYHYNLKQKLTRSEAVASDLSVKVKILEENIRNNQKIIDFMSENRIFIENLEISSAKDKVEQEKKAKIYRDNTEKAKETLGDSKIGPLLADRLNALRENQ